MSVSGISNITPVDPKREALAVQQVAPAQAAGRDSDGDGDKAKPATSRESGHKVDIRA